MLDRYLLTLLRLEEVDLEERLEVQVRDRVRVLDLQQAGQHTIGDDVTLVGGVEARVLLDVVGHELRDLRLRTLGTGRQLHERAQVGRQGTRLQERVLRAAELPRRLLLGRHVGDVLLDTTLTLRILDLAGRRLGSHEQVGDDLLQLVRLAGADLAETLNNASDRGRGSSGLRRRGRGQGHGRGSDRRHNDLGLGRRLAGGLRGLGGISSSRGSDDGRGGGGLLGGSSGLLRGLGGISRAHRVYNRGRRLCGHF